MNLEVLSDTPAIVPDDSPATTSSRGRETLDRIAILEAEAKASRANMEALGAMLCTLAESPGIQGAIEGFGRAAVLSAEAQKLAIETKHEQEMQAAKLASDERMQGERLRHEASGQARWIGAGIFVVMVLAALGVAYTMVALVVKEILTREHAIIVGGAVGAVIVAIAQRFKVTS